MSNVKIFLVDFVIAVFTSYPEDKAGGLCVFIVSAIGMFGFYYGSTSQRGWQGDTNHKGQRPVVYPVWMWQRLLRIVAGVGESSQLFNKGKRTKGGSDEGNK